MNKENKNTDFWIGRIVILFFFLFILAFSESNSNSHSDTCTVSIVQVENENSAILIKPFDIPEYDISLVNCELSNINIWDSESGIRISDNNTNHEFKSKESRFLKFKPKLVRQYLTHFMTSPGEDPALIS